MASLHTFLLLAAFSSGGEPVLLNFTANWCGACRTMGPTLERLRDAGYQVRTVNVDHQPDLARQFGVRPIPCFVLVANGQEAERVVGAASFDRLVRLFHNAGFRPGSHSDPSFRGQSPDNHYGTNTDAPPPARHEPTRQFPPVGPEVGRGPQVAPRQQPPQPVALGRSLTPHQLAMQATVRLTVIDATGQSHGTGTIVDLHGQEALVVTCGHIFRESKGDAEIRVDLFAPGANGPVPGYLLSYECEERDIGLICIRPGIPITPVKVASPEYLPRRGEAIFTIGCNHGADPTIKASTISAINRYIGSPNLEVLGHPVEGRSGGGLFTFDGRLIGICNAADLEEDRGIYASLPIIHLELRRIGQERIFTEQQTIAPTSVTDSRVAPLPDTTPISPTNHLTGQTPAVGGDMEVICIVRSRANPRCGNKVYVLDHPSADLIQRLTSESHPLETGAAQLATLPRQGQETPSQSSALPAQGPIVRAQSR